MLVERKCGKRGDERRWKLEDVPWKMCSGGWKDRKWRENKEPNGSTRTKRDHRQNFGFTSHHTLRSVGDVIQGDVCPHVSTHLCLEGHSERRWVGQDDICVRPLATMVSRGCPHQQTGATGSNSVDLVRCKTKLDTLRLCSFVGKIQMYFFAEMIFTYFHTLSNVWVNEWTVYTIYTG